MNITEFVSKWGQSTLTERSASQQHFLDLCDLIGHPKPAALDPTPEQRGAIVAAAEADARGDSGISRQR